MVWRLGIMAAIWVLLWGSQPAAAAIRHFVDSRGVIHISNAGAAKPGARSPVRPPEQPSPAAPALTPPANEPQAAAPTPAGTTPPAVAKAHRGSEGAAPDSQQGHRRKPEVQADLQGGDGPRAPVQPVSWTAPAASLSKSPAGAAESVIRKYRDRHGVLHITNVSPAPTPAGPAVQLAQGQEGQGPAAPPTAPDLTESLQPGPGELLPGFKQVAYTREEVLADVWGRLPARKAAGAIPGAIRRYRDARGVLHIENGPPLDLGPVDSRRWLAMTGAGKGRDQPHLNKNVQPGGQDEIMPRLAVKPAPDASRAPPVTPLLMASRSSPVPTAGTLRRYRDAKGVWHIESVEPAGPLPVQLADQLPGAVSRVFAGLQPGEAAAAALGKSMPPAVPGASRVVAYRDHRGRLKIVNQEADPRMARAPPAGGMLEPLILEAAQVYGLPPALIRAVIKVESNFVAWAVSPKGAIGLMQLMPGTADFLGVRDPFSPRENIHGGCRYLRLLLDSFGGSLPLALAAYNAGFQRVVNCGFQVPAIKETQDFVTQVMGLYYLGEKRGPWPWV